MCKLKGWGYGLLVLFVLTCSLVCRSTAQRPRSSPAPEAPFPDVQGTPSAWELNAAPEIPVEWSELPVIRLARPGATAEALGDVAIHAITRQGDALWIATDSGLLHLNPTTLVYDHITPADGLGGAQVVAVAVAEDGGVWAATSGGLSYRAPGAEWVNYTAQNTEGDLPEGTLTAVLPFQGKVWVGTEHGARVFTLEARGTWQSPVNIPAARVLALAPGPNADVWVVTSKGTYRVTDNVTEKISEMWAPSALARNEQGWLWVAQEGYPTLIKPGTKWEYLQGAPRTLKRDVLALAPGNAPERVWIATQNALGRYQEHWLEGPMWQTLTLPEALDPATVTALSLDGNNNLWIGTTSGLWRHQEPWVHQFTDQPLPFNARVLASINFDDRGNLWVFPGAWRFDGQTWKSYQGVPPGYTPLVLGDGADGVWVIHTLGAINYFDGESWHSAASADEQLHCSAEVAAVDLPRNSLWIGGGGLCGLTLVTWDSTYTTFEWQNFELLRGTKIAGVVVRQDGSVWVAAGRWGLLRYLDGDWTVYDRQPIWQLVQDAEGRLCTVRDDQPVCFDGQQWETVFETGFGYGGVRNLLADRAGGLWIQHGRGGLSYFYRGMRWIYTSADGLPDPIFDTAINPVDHRLWLISEQSTFFRFDEPRWERIQLP